MTKKSAFLILVFVGFIINIFPETRDIRFKHLSIEQGLSQSIVYSIAQDNRGFMWFATEDGLNRYDGYKFIVLRPDPKNTNSLSHSNIWAIYVDQPGIIWVGTFHGGLTSFNPETGNYCRYRKNPDDPNTISDDVIRSIYEDSSGVLWVGTDDGLNKFDRETETFTHYKNVPGNPNSLSNNEVYSICEDQSGVLWIGTHGGGLNKFDMESEIFTHYKSMPHDPNSLSSDEILTLFKDPSGVLWIGTNGGGLNRFDTRTGCFMPYQHQPGDPNSLGNNVVRAIYEDHTGTLWIGTDAGLCKFNKETGRFTTYQNEPGNPFSLGYNEIRAIYEDRAGVMWIGTYGGGINKFNAKKKKFIHYKPDPNDPNSLSHEIVWSFYEDPSGILWIGTHSGGLNKFDRKKNRFTIYRANPNVPNSLSNDTVRVVYGDKSGILWIGTNGGGINKFNKETETFTRYKYVPDNPHSLSHDEIRAIYEDRFGVLWIGTHGGGLNKFNRETGTFIRYQANDSDPGSLSNDVVRSICEDHSGVLWIGTYGGGLNKFNRESETFTQYRASPHNPNSLSNDYVFSVYEDTSHVLWIGTWGGGLNRFNREEESFTTFGKAEGMPTDSIYGMLEDHQGYLWISSSNGLIKFDPRTGKCKHYRESDGLQSNEFNGGAVFKSSSGEMFFGGIHGFNAFYPDTIEDNQYIPPIVITSFQKLNKEVKLGQPIAAIKELTLSYRDYFFSFEFAALDYTAPLENKYAYKMEGLDDDWIYTDSNKRFATYTTLAPGNYTFWVKGSNNDGIWNEAGTSMAITITPPFWKTLWFQALSVIVFVLIVWILYKKRMKNFFLRTRMETELQTAHDAQMSIMPQKGPEINGFDISGVCIPANEVGGDFFDYLWLDEKKTHIGIAVGDVSGKAMKAAMTAVMANGIIFSKASETHSITEIMSQLNKSLYFKTDKKVFTALLIISIDIDTKEMAYTNAGLPKPLLKSSNSIITLKSTGSKFPLGFIEEKHFQEENIRLNPGDVLVLYTDGVSESWNLQHEFYGSDHLRRFLKNLDTLNLSSNIIIDKIMEDVKKFTEEVDQHDDITVVVVKVL